MGTLGPKYLVYGYLDPLGCVGAQAPFPFLVYWGLFRGPLFREPSQFGALDVKTVQPPRHPRPGSECHSGVGEGRTASDHGCPGEAYTAYIITVHMTS